MTEDRPGQDVPRARSVRLSEAEVTTLWDSLDREDSQTARKDRAHAYVYRHPALQLDLWQLGGSTFVPYAVPSRRLSATGLSLLFGNYLHPGCARPTIFARPTGALGPALDDVASP